MSIFRVLFFLFITTSYLFSSENLEKVTLQLNWKYQFEFAGFIAAKEKGYYKELGLDLDIKEFDFGVNVLDEVKSGKATFGVYDLSLLHLVDEEKPVKLIANYFKRSALVFIAKQDILTPFDLENRTIMADLEQLESSTLKTLLKKFGIKKEDYTFRQHNFKADDFINGKVDVMSAYISNELYHVRESKIPFNIIDPLNYGIYGSGVNVFTSKKTTDTNPKLVEKFLKASKKGWEYSLQNKEEVVELIYNKYSKLKSKEALLFEANQTEKLVMPKIYRIGEINKKLIQKNINDFEKDGLLPNSFNIDSLIYESKASSLDDDTLQFTKEQEEYILEKDKISMCIDPDWMPYEKLENGLHIGMTSDYFKILEKRIRIPIEVVPTESWSQSMEYGKSRKCDIFSLVMATPSRLEYMNFTTPYLSFPLVLATRMDTLFISNPESLVTKEKIGIVKGYSILELLKNKYPNNKIVEVETLKEGLELVESGEIYGFIGALSAIGHELQYNFFGELKIAGKLDRDIELGVAVRNDDPILFELFQKAVQSIATDTSQKILNKYVSIQLESGFDYKLFYQILFIVILGILLLFFRHRQVVKYNTNLEKKQKELYETKNQLEASLKNFQTLIDSLIEGIVVSEDGICIEINDEVIKLLGYESKDELLGKNIFDFISPDYQEVVKDKFSIESCPVYEIKALKKDGSEIDILVKGTNSIFNGKKVRISAFVDITETKQKDRLLFQQSKMAAMGEMIDNIAHQWRQPLSLISTISTSMAVKDEMGLLEKEDIHKDCDKISAVTQHLSKTIDDFRNFFKEEKEIVEFSLLKSINKNIDLLESTFKNHNIDMVFENIEDVSISSYENEFTQALINIFYNAKDALVENNKEIKKLILINMQIEDSFVKLEIKDNAGGIPESILGNIFDPYFTTKHQSQGTGIGLYMTHQIIHEHMGGSIFAKNHTFIYDRYSYSGAKFIIKLPLKK